MQLSVQQKLMNDSKMATYLKQNSNWYKYLNRNPESYKTFTDAMKELYKTRPTDKISDVIENIDLISSVLNVLK